MNHIIQKINILIFISVGVFLKYLKFKSQIKWTKSCNRKKVFSPLIQTSHLLFSNQKRSLWNQCIFYFLSPASQVRDSELLRPGTLLFLELTKTKTFLCLIQPLKSMTGKSVMITYSISAFHISPDYSLLTINDRPTQVFL